MTDASVFHSFGTDVARTCGLTVGGQAASLGHALGRFARPILDHAATTASDAGRITWEAAHGRHTHFDDTRFPMPGGQNLSW